MVQSTTSPVRGKPRVLRTWLEITDQRGRLKCYTVKPVQLPGYKLAYRLVPYNTTLARAAQQVQPPQDPYYCTLDLWDQVACNCDGFIGWGHCKHVKCLQKLNLLPTPPRALPILCPTGATL